MIASHLRQAKGLVQAVISSQQEGLDVRMWQPQHSWAVLTTGSPVTSTADYIHCPLTDGSPKQRGGAASPSAAGFPRKAAKFVLGRKECGQITDTIKQGGELLKEQAQLNNLMLHTAHSRHHHVLAVTMNHLLGNSQCFFLLCKKYHPNGESPAAWTQSREQGGWG